VAYDRNRRHDLQQVRRQTLEQSAPALVLQRLSRDIHDPSVSPWVARSALTLQSRPQQVQRIDDTRAKRTTETTHKREREISRKRILIVLRTCLLRIPRNHLLLQRLEHEEVDCSVREHAHQTHGQSAVKGSDSVARPHLLCCVPDEFVAALAADDGLALHAELECVERVDDCLAHHAGHTACDEL